MKSYSPYSDELKQRHPYEPWKWREDWLLGRGVPTGPFTGGSGKLAVFLGAGITLMVFALALIMELNKDSWFGNGKEHVPYLWWAAFLIIFVGTCAYLKLQQRKYSGVFFMMDQVPVWVGGKLSGVVAVGTSFRPSGHIKSALSCYQTIDRGRSDEVNMLWNKELTLPPDIVEHPGGRIPVSFDIPVDCQGTSWGYNEKTEWWLDVGAPTPGINLDARFAVPIFPRPPDPNRAVAIETRQESDEPPVLPPRNREGS